MIRFDQFLGNRPAVDLLSRMLRTGRVPHALLLNGPEGVGKRSLADAFAAALVCESPSPESCGDCGACRLVEHGTHPDLLLFERLPRKNSTELRQFIIVDQVRRLSQLASMAPRQAPRRVFVIDPADRMNGEAQNALLKTLEEPPGRTVIVLLAARPQLLLPTVRSRCFSVSLGAARPHELARLLERQGLPADEALARAALAGGRPGRALALDLDDLRDRREWALSALEGLTASRDAAARIPALAAELAASGEAELLAELELIEALLRDAGLSAAGASEVGLAHADVKPRLDRIGRALGAQRSAALIGSLERMRNDLRLNLNRKLLAEALFAAIAGGPIP